MKRYIIFALTLLLTTGLSAQGDRGDWKPVGNRKIRANSNSFDYAPFIRAGFFAQSRNERD